jgi:phage gpG-like protein
MTNIELKVTHNDVQQGLQDLLEHLTNTAPVFASISQEFATQTELIIQNEGPGYSTLNANIKGRGTASGGWPQLAPRTIKQRGSAHPILQITGALARSFLPYSGDDYAGIGSNDPRAAIHFFGGKIQMPARSQQAYFRQDQKTGEVGNKFVKKKKSNFAQWVTIPAYVINIPARPMFPVDAEGNLLPHVAETLLEIFADYLLE